MLAHLWAADHVGSEIIAQALPLCLAPEKVEDVRNFYTVGLGLTEVKVGRARLYFRSGLNSVTLSSVDERVRRERSLVVWRMEPLFRRLSDLGCGFLSRTGSQSLLTLDPTGNRIRVTGLIG